MRDVFLALLTGLVADNLVCSRLIGITGSEFSLDTFRNSALFGALVTAVGFGSVLICYPVYRYLLCPAGIEYFYILLCVPVTTAVAALLFRLLPSVSGRYNHIQKIALAATSLGTVLLCLMQNNMLLALISALSYGIGLILVLCIFFCARLSLKESRLPAAFKGSAIDLVIIAVIALVFYGFRG